VLVVIDRLYRTKLKREAVDSFLDLRQVVNELNDFLK
jgi:hypothetical protein